MVEQQVLFESNFEQAGKEYKSILAIPLVLDAAVPFETIGVISVDSGRRGEFDKEIVANLEQRLSPFVNLLGLLLVMQTALKEENKSGAIA